MLQKIRSFFLNVFCLRYAFTAPIQTIQTPSGAVIVIESSQGPGISIAMLCDTTRLAPNLPARNCVHLLEHLIAQTHVNSLEQAGLFFLPATYYDHLLLSILGKPDHLLLALKTFKEIMKASTFSSEQIKKEIAILKHELALVPIRDHQNEQLIKSIFGETYTRAYGEISEFEKTTPDQLSALQRELCRAENIVISVYGAFQKKVVLEAIKTIIPELWTPSKAPKKNFIVPNISETVKSANPSLFFMPGIHTVDGLMSYCALLSFLETDGCLQIYSDASVYPRYASVEKKRPINFKITIDSLKQGIANFREAWRLQTDDIRGKARMNGLLAMNDGLINLPELIEEIEKTPHDKFDAELKKVKAQLDKVPLTTENKQNPYQEIELITDAILSSDVLTHRNILAYYALTAGCGSSFFRVAREKNAWAYKLEARLVSRNQGWHFVLGLQVPKTTNAHEINSKLKSELLQDIDQWNDKHLLRAKNLAESCYSCGMNINPLDASVLPPPVLNLESLDSVKKIARDLVNQLKIVPTLADPY